VVKDTCGVLLHVLPTPALSKRQVYRQVTVESVYPDDAAITAELQAASTSNLRQDDVELGRELLRATRPFASESRAESWWQVSLIFVLMIGSLTAAGLSTWWPVRTAFAVLGALFMVRAFITFHDFMHGAILQKSKLATALFNVYGAFALTPTSSWKKSHNHHHGHVGQITTETIGAFPILTTKMWSEASLGRRAGYRATRHPLLLLFGYITIFFFSVTLQPLLVDPKHHWDSAFSLLLHGGLIALLWIFGGFDMAFFVVLLPMTLASLIGSYLFFAQHSFKHMQIVPAESWSFYRASLVSSSYLRLGKWMQWFTGNIGFHHVHHLNVRIPFYRLPEAMAAIPALRTPITISLAPRDIIDSFKACLWDEQRQRMVSYAEARRHARAER
jgi:omega-6 fatty acid desaturase (delta-12 desaturase)